MTADQALVGTTLYSATLFASGPLVTAVAPAIDWNPILFAIITSAPALTAWLVQGFRAFTTALGHELKIASQAVEIATLKEELNLINARLAVADAERRAMGTAIQQAGERISDSLTKGAENAAAAVTAWEKPS